MLHHHAAGAQHLALAVPGLRLQPGRHWGSISVRRVSPDSQRRQTCALQLRPFRYWQDRRRPTCNPQTCRVQEPCTKSALTSPGGRPDEPQSDPSPAGNTCACWDLPLTSPTLDASCADYEQIASFPQVRRDGLFTPVLHHRALYRHSMPVAGRHELSRRQTPPLATESRSGLCFCYAAARVACRYWPFMFCMNPRPQARPRVEILRSGPC